MTFYTPGDCSIDEDIETKLRADGWQINEKYLTSLGMAFGKKVFQMFKVSGNEQNPLKKLQENLSTNYIDIETVAFEPRDPNAPEPTEKYILATH